MLTANKLHSDTNNTEGSEERGTKRMRERERQLDGGGVVGVWRLGQRANSVGPTPLTPGDKWQVQCWRRCCMQHAWERQRRFDLSPSLTLSDPCWILRYIPALRSHPCNLSHPSMATTVICPAIIESQCNPFPPPSSLPACHRCRLWLMIIL